MKMFQQHLKPMVALGVSLLATGVMAVQTYVTDAQTSQTAFSIGSGGNEICHVEPGGSITVLPNSSNFSYVEILNRSTCELWLEGGTVTANELVLRGPASTYRQYSGTLNLSSTERGIIIDAGEVEISGGVATAPVTFRNCTSASFRMLGGTLISAFMTGDNMANVDFAFAATNAYAVVGSIDAVTAYAITMKEPITRAPKSLTITGTPVSGCVYGLVSGITNDTFFTANTPGVPEGWSLVRRGDKLLLVETATLDVATANWTGAANDGNPRTPGNWTCLDASGETLDGVLPGVDTLAYVPAEAVNFTFPATNSIALGGLYFLGDTCVLDRDADWSGLTAGVVKRYPTTIDVNGHVLRLSDELPKLELNFDDLTEPGGAITVDVTPYSGSAAYLIDNEVSASSRLLVGSSKQSASTECNVCYDFGAEQGKVVRGVRFHASINSLYSAPRRPKVLEIYGTVDDPNSAAPNWMRLASYSNLDLQANDWSDYLTFDNETPYRAYRIHFIENVSNDARGNYLELWEMEFVSAPELPSHTVTSSVAGGELHFDVPERNSASVTQTALAGSLKVVKEGAGLLNMKREHQTYTGGTVVAGGRLQSDAGPGTWAFGCDGDTAPDAQKICIRPDGELYLTGETKWDTTKVFLEGGTISGYTEKFNPQIVVSADSKVNVLGVYFSPCDSATGGLDLGGHTLTTTIDVGKSLNQTLSSLSNGVIDVLSGGWFANLLPLDARTVDLKMGASLRIAADLSVRDYEAKFTNPNANEGTAALNVFGTFTPTTDCFYGCTMMDGSTIDLSARTGEWSTTSAFTGSGYATGLRTVSFADNACVLVDLGARKVRVDERVVSWTDKPANFDTLKFKLKGRPMGGLAKRDDGLYFVESMMVIIR